MNPPQNPISDVIKQAIPDQRGIRLPEIFSQAGTMMMMSYFGMKLYSLVQDKDNTIADLESKGIAADRAQIVYMAYVAAMAAGIFFISFSRRASYKAQIGLAFLAFVVVTEVMFSQDDQMAMFKNLSIAGGLMIAMD